MHYTIWRLHSAYCAELPYCFQPVSASAVQMVKDLPHSILESSTSKLGSCLWFGRKGIIAFRFTYRSYHFFWKFYHQSTRQSFSLLMDAVFFPNLPIVISSFTSIFANEFWGAAPLIGMSLWYYRWHSIYFNFQIYLCFLLTAMEKKKDISSNDETFTSPKCYLSQISDSKTHHSACISILLFELFLFLIAK